MSEETKKCLEMAASAMKTFPEGVDSIVATMAEMFAAGVATGVDIKTKQSAAADAAES